MTAPARSTVERPVRIPRRAPEPPPRATPLRVVPTPRRHAPRAPFVIVVVVLLVSGLLGLLALNTLLAQGSFTLHGLQARSADLSEREQVLQQEVAAAQAPAALAMAATRLGMVPGGPPLFLRTSDGAVLGDPTAKSTPTGLTKALATLAAAQAAAPTGAPAGPTASDTAAAATGTTDPTLPTGAAAATTATPSAPVTPVSPDLVPDNPVGPTTP